MAVSGLRIGLRSTDCVRCQFYWSEPWQSLLTKQEQAAKLYNKNYSWWMEKNISIKVAAGVCWCRNCLVGKYSKGVRLWWQIKQDQNVMDGGHHMSHLSNTSKAVKFHPLSTIKRWRFLLMGDMDSLRNYWTSENSSMSSQDSEQDSGAEIDLGHIQNIPEWGNNVNMIIDPN